MTDSQHGFLLMADISGYSVFLNQSELEHARDTLASLIEVLVDGTRPPLVVSKLEGDAVLSYSPDAAFLKGQTLIDMIESTYVAFRRAINLMVINNSCGCQACTNVSTLDLKFFVNHGVFAIQQIGDHQELFGNDVVVTHRLLKNTITADTGIKAYTAYTETAMTALGDEMKQGMAPLQLSYDDVGEIVVWVEDMHPVWESKKDDPIVELSPDDTLVSASLVIDAPREVVWDYLSDVRFRKTLNGSDRQEVVDLIQGRIDRGSTFQCYHGDRVVSQLILEWRPFERLVTRDRIPNMGGVVQVVNVIELEPDGPRTIVTFKVGGLTGPAVRRRLAAMVLSRMREQFLRDGDRFKEHVEADFGARAIEVART